MHSSRTLVLAAALVAVAVAVAVAGPGAASDERFRVLLVGDSITAGYVGTAGGDPKGESFAVRLVPLLGADFEVINVGCAGSTSIDWRSGAPPQACGTAQRALYEDGARPHLPVDLAVVMLGTNGAAGRVRHGGPLAPLRYRLALRNLALALLADGAAAVVLVPPPPAPEGAPEGMSGRLQRYGKVLFELCDELSGVICGPDVQGALDPAVHFPPANVHPNSTGHAVLAAALAPAVRAARVSALAAPYPRYLALTAVAVVLGLGLWLFSHKSRRNEGAASMSSRTP